MGADQRVRRAEVTSSGSRIVGGSGSIGQPIEAVPKRGRRHWRKEIAPDAQVDYADIAIIFRFRSDDRVARISTAEGIETVALEDETQPT